MIQEDIKEIGEESRQDNVGAGDDPRLVSNIGSIRYQCMQLEHPYLGTVAEDQEEEDKSYDTSLENQKDKGGHSQSIDT